MLIDQFMPEYHMSDGHAIDVRAPIQIVYQVVRSLEVGHSRGVRWLFQLRWLSRWHRLPADVLSLNGMLKIGFVLLGEDEPRELAFGVIGRFWLPSSGILRVDPAAFVQFDKSGFAKGVMNFSLVEKPDGTCKVATETRVQCLGPASRRLFGLYWLLIGPFSAWIRQEWLRIIKQKSECLAKRANSLPVMSMADGSSPVSHQPRTPIRTL